MIYVYRYTTRDLYNFWCTDRRKFIRSVSSNEIASLFAFSQEDFQHMIKGGKLSVELCWAHSPLIRRLTSGPDCSSTEQRPLVAKIDSIQQIPFLLEQFPELFI